MFCGHALLFGDHVALGRLLSTSTGGEGCDNSGEIRHVWLCLYAQSHTHTFFSPTSFIKCCTICLPFSLWPHVARQLQLQRRGTVCSSIFSLFFCLDVYQAYIYSPKAVPCIFVVCGNLWLATCSRAPICGSWEAFLNRGRMSVITILGSLFFTSLQPNFFGFMSLFYSNFMYSYL